MKKVSYIVRLDDASEYMSLDRWEAFFNIFDLYGVKPIVAVIPHVEDKKLIADNPFIGDFWERVEAWQQKGYVIALHGYNHVYTTKNSGIIKKNQRSEFAGVSYKKQAEKIKKGWQIFKEHGIKSRVFVAPAHSFDENTLKALQAETDICIVSDGFTHDTFHYKGMYWIPQQISRPEEKEFGVWTICYHPETAEQWQLDELKQFIAAHLDAFVNPENISLSSNFAASEKKLFREHQNQFIKKHRREMIKRTKHNIMSFLYQLKRTPIRIQKSLLQTLSPILPDKLYIRWLYRLKLGRSLNLKNPRTFQEKIQWMKLYFRDPQQSILADKVAVKDWLKNVIPEEHIIPTLGVYKQFDEIDFSKLPEAFVLKTNHGFGNTSICYDKNTFDYGRAREKLTNGLKRNYYLWTREWAYKNISPRIIAEPLLAHNIPDYKWWCFDGEPKYCEIIQSRWADSPMTTDFFDVNWQHQEFIGLDIRYQSSQELIEKPATFDIQLSLAQILCKGFPFVRVDLYDVNGQVFVGEMTFYPTSGIGRFLPEKYDYILGDMITLPKKLIV